MARKYNVKYQKMICKDVPKKKLESIEDRGGGLEKKCNRDPWIDNKPIVPNGFIDKSCKEY